MGIKGKKRKWQSLLMNAKKGERGENSGRLLNFGAKVLIFD